MGKKPFENRAQLRLSLIDGQWQYVIYGPKQSAQETGGFSGRLPTTQTQYPTLDEAVAAFKEEYDVR